MPRYVILWHEAGPALGRPSHFDLLFEEGLDARAWCIEQEITPSKVHIASELPRHRLHYLTYEGPISGNRGAVTRWDSGDYEALLTTIDCFEVRLRGQRLNGTLQLSHEANEKWRLQFKAAT